MHTSACLTALIGLGATALLSGCAVGVATHETSGIGEADWVEYDELRALVDTNKDIRLGMTVDEAMGLYPPDVTSLVSAARIDGVAIQEWRVQAYTEVDDDIEATFRRWLYFADGELIRLIDERIPVSLYDEMLTP